eukprot:m.293184 g.293184  ORF g.293184 m.293184 type:complete len:108 (-) comp27137_c0_seq2:9-332(-)
MDAAVLKKDADAAYRSGEPPPIHHAEQKAAASKLQCLRTLTSARSLILIWGTAWHIIVCDVSGLSGSIEWQWGGVLAASTRAWVAAARVYRTGSPHGRRPRHSLFPP